MPIYERMTVKGRAGALQPYQSSQQAVAPGATSARVSDAAGAIYARGASMANEGLGRLAGAIGKAGHTFLNAYEDYSKTKATELFNRYREGMTQALDGENGILHQVGESAFHAGQQTMGTSSGMRADLLKDYGEDSRVAQIFNQLVDPQENAYHVKAQQHGEKEYKLWQDRTDDAAAKGWFDEALANVADPEKFRQGAASALWYVEQQLARKGYSGEALERGLLEASSKIYKGGIEAAIGDEDYATAERLLNEARQNGRMTEAEAHDAKLKIQKSYENDIKLKATEYANNEDLEALKRLRAGGGAPFSSTGLNSGISSVTGQFAGRTKYGFGSRDPRSGSVDCSGWTGYAIESCGVKGYRGLTADKQVEKAQKEGGVVTMDELARAPHGGIVIGLDQGKKGWDAGRKNGIDHVVVTYEDPNTGQVMVSESSGSKGVHSQTLASWLDYHVRKGHKIFAGNMSGQGAGGITRPTSSRKLSSATELAIDSLISRVEGLRLGRQLGNDVVGEKMTASEAMEKINGITDPKKQSMARAQFGQELKMKEYADKEQVKEATAKAGQYVQGMRDKFDSDPAAATKEFWDEVQRAENAALTGSKADKEYSKILRQVYDGLGTGLSRNTDPAVYNGISARIGSGEITSQKQLDEIKEYTVMTPKDQKALSTQLKKSQSVNYKMLEQAFSNMFPSDIDMTSDEKKQRDASWRAFKQFAYDYFMETNRAENPEAYDRIAQVFFRKSFKPGFWDSSSEPYGVYAARNDWDALPELSDQEKAYAAKTLASSRGIAMTFQKAAGQWKEDNNSFADLGRVTEMVFLRSQEQGAIRADKGPRRPDNVPDKAKWGQNKKYNCYGWTWVDGNEAKFEPYVYTVKR